MKSYEKDRWYIGIGINVNLKKEDLTEDLLDKDLSINESIRKDINRQKLLASVISVFENLYIPFKEKVDLSKYINIFRENSILIGREVKIIKKNSEVLGIVMRP